jgi:hypothetical protein
VRVNVRWVKVQRCYIGITVVLQWYYQQSPVVTQVAEGMWLCIHQQTV